MSSKHDKTGKSTKKVVIIDDTPPQTPAPRTRHARAAAIPKPANAPAALGKSGLRKKKDPAPGALSVRKTLELATPKADKNLRKHRPKDEEASDDDESDEEAPSSELCGDEAAEEGADDRFATHISSPPTVTDGEDVAKETDDDATKKRKRSNRSPIPVPQKSARREGQTAPARKTAVDTNEPADTTSSSAPARQATPSPAAPTALSAAPAASRTAPVEATAALPATTPSLVTVASASPLKSVVPHTGAKTLLANAEKMQKTIEKNYVDISDSGSDAPIPPPKKKHENTKTAKAKQKEKEKRKQKEKKKGKEGKREKDSKAKSSDIDMEEHDDVKPTKGKQREAPTKREMKLEAEVEKLRRLIAKQNEKLEDSSDANSDVTDGDKSSEDEADAKPTKKGKGPAKKAQSTTTESSEEEDAKPTKKGKGPVKSTKSAADDPALYSYYKAQKGDVADMAIDLKNEFTVRTLLNWWPEEAERILLGEEAYSEALKKFRNTINVDDISSDSEVTSARKIKSLLKAPFKYDHNIRKIVSKFPTELRNNARNAVVDAVEGAYEIRTMPEDFTGTPVEYTQDRVSNLIGDFAFAKDPDDPTALIGSHLAFINLLMKHFGKPDFMRQRKMVDALRPMPPQCIAIMVAAIHYSLDRFSDGGPGRKIAFQESTYKVMYDIVLQSLTHARKEKAAKYQEMMDKYNEAMPNIGANSSKARSVAKVFEDSDVKAEIKEEARDDD